MADERNDLETCGCCGNRSRRKDCLMCPGCRRKFDEELNRSAQALLDDDFASIVKIPDEFQYVLDRSEHAVNTQQNRLAEAEEHLRVEELRISEAARSFVRTKLLARGCKNPGKTVAAEAVVISTNERKEVDGRYKKAYGRAFGLRKGLERLNEFLEGVQLKREKYLAEQELQQTEKKEVA